MAALLPREDRKYAAGCVAVVLFTPIWIAGVIGLGIASVSQPLFALAWLAWTFGAGQAVIRYCESSQLGLRANARKRRQAAVRRIAEEEWPD